MALNRRHGDLVRPDGASGANELFAMGGHTGTHIDALCHVSLNMKLHGGLDAAEASRGGRFQHLGVETIAPMLCRGVLLDVPRALGREVLDAAQAVTDQDLMATCRAQGVEVGRGDAVLVRSGWPVGRYQDSAAYLGWTTGVPGRVGCALAG
jgi:kynurenine formamidase